MARFFIDRPVFAIVIAIVISIIGTLAGFSLPIAQYPDITKPQIEVQTVYVGANASTVEESVAQAVEQNVNGVENMRDMRSTATNTGRYVLDVNFNLGKNADIGSVEVQNRVSQASASMPAEVLAYGITTAKKSSQTIMFLCLRSPNKTYDGMFLKTYALVNFVDAIKRCKGVSSVESYGPEYAMRINLKPDKMAEMNITTEEIAAAVKAQNIQAPVGAIGSRPTVNEQEMYYSARAEGRLNTVEEFGNIIIRSVKGQNLKLRDVAEISPGDRMDFPVGMMDGGDSVVFPVYLTSDANAIESVNSIREVIEDARRRLPPDMELMIAEDNTQFIKESLSKVAHTFFEALVLVLLVVYIFLGSWRATLIPMLVVPVSLIGTFASFVILGFTINTLTMFAMILAIGLVVDDAIVVVEAVEHHIQENGLEPREATYRAMEEVSGPVVAIAFVLAAVFIPVSFTAGTTGQLYKQFALTISVSMGLSALMALVLTPALCAMFLKKEEGITASTEAPKGFVNKIIYRFNVWYNNTLEKYIVRVRQCIDHRKFVLIGWVVMAVLIAFAFKITPSGYVPNEDQGMFMVPYSLPEGASSNRSIQQVSDLAEELRKLDGVEHVMTVSGYDPLVGAPKASAGLAMVIMKEFSDRATSTFDLIGRVYGLAPKYPGMNLMAFNAAPLPGLSDTGSLGLYVMNLAGDDLHTMNGFAREFIAKANQRPEIGICYTTFNTDTPAYKFNVDRVKAQSLQVPVAKVFGALQVFLGGSEINDFNAFGRTWKVVMQAEPKYRNDINSLRMFYVHNNNGELVPLSALVSVEEESTVPAITRFNGASAFKIAGDPAAGYSTGQAMQALEEVAAEVLPTTYTFEWVDQSRDEKEAGSGQGFIYTISLVFVFLCLAALYESWNIPLAVLLSVPPAILGCLGSQLLRGQRNDIYMQVAMIMLIGLAAKNAILIVEYAVINRKEHGMGIIEAAVEASKLRLRPILMTSFAFILGCVPLAIATGAGAGARVSMGNAVVGGMTFATFVGIFLIPVMYVVVERFFEKKKG